MTAIHEQIDILKRAQELDAEIHRAKEALEDIPLEREKLNTGLEQEKARMHELEQALQKTHLRQKEKEKDLASKEENVKKLDGQLGQVKTNKEYGALQQEIASLKADNSILEEEIIKLFDEVEAASEEAKKEKERLKEVEQNFKTKETEIAQLEKKAHETVTGLKKERDEIVESVPPEIKDQYNVIVSRRQGIALAKIEGEICGVCKMSLRAQVIHEAQLGEAIITCDNCSRILYVEKASA